VYHHPAAAAGAKAAQSSDADKKSAALQTALTSALADYGKF
jgi:hypothetical protein